MERRYKFRHVNEISGGFVLAVVAIVVIALIWSGKSQRWFVPKFALMLELPERGASGLSRGNEVFILGLSAGTVDQIIVEDDGSMKAKLKISRDFQRFIRSDSVASIKKTFGVAGDSLVEITRGYGPPLPLKNPVIRVAAGDENKMEKVLSDLNTEALPLLRKASGILDEWTRLGTNLNTSQDRLRSVLTRIDNIAIGVEQGRGVAGKLLTSQEAGEDLHRLITQAHQSMNQLQAVLQNLEKASQPLPQITGSVAHETKDLSGMVLQARQTLAELERLVGGLQKNWLVRRHLDNEPAPARIPPEKVEREAP